MSELQKWRAENPSLTETLNLYSAIDLVIDLQKVQPKQPGFSFKFNLKNLAYLHCYQHYPQNK